MFGKNKNIEAAEQRIKVELSHLEIARERGDEVGAKRASKAIQDAHDEIEKEVRKNT